MGLNGNGFDFCDCMNSMEAGPSLCLVVNPILSTIHDCCCPLVFVKLISLNAWDHALKAKVLASVFSLLSTSH